MNQPVALRLSAAAVKAADSSGLSRSSAQRAAVERIAAGDLPSVADRTRSQFTVRIDEHLHEQARLVARERGFNSLGDAVDYLLAQP